MNFKNYKEGIILFIAQFILCLVVTINYRSIAQANYLITGLSSVGIAITSFFLIKKISKKSEHPVAAWSGFILGSVCGDFAGIFLSKLMLGS
jgi:uncharacterized membrane protein YoaK (UPF0700 family)